MTRVKLTRAQFVTDGTNPSRGVSERDQQECCTCRIVDRGDFAAVREYYGERTHATYCPVGKRERAEAESPDFVEYENAAKRVLGVTA